ncbi:hypothetical protein ZOSMA_159G00510 [Zostera marina]|uniref:60S ribosomal protein L18a-like protein n=1 Tax=Zostera marina TaxID=29655 RepID=A0A0K9PXB1_ZOSMR|nr:hypothetical protein ZOSMA_159G00510 [Zostera marina]
MENIEGDASGSKNSRVPIPDQDEIQENNQRPHYQTNTYNVKPLFFFGCGIGWFSFTLGFLFPFLWYFATILYFRNYHLRNPRERQGLAASAIAALICSVAVLVALLIALIPRN